MKKKNMFTNGVNFECICQTFKIFYVIYQKEIHITPLPVKKILLQFQKNFIKLNEKSQYNIEYFEGKDLLLNSINMIT